MPNISATNLTVKFPLYHFGARSLKKSVAGLMSGRRMQLDTGRLVISALNELSFTINSGERVGLFGHNGAGKTTLLKVLSGVYAPSVGTVSRIGSVGSLVDLGAAIDPMSTGWENIDLNLRFQNANAEQIPDLKRKIGEDTGLGDFLDLPVRNYSAGMNVRLSFAIETHWSPEILLLDEWLSVGDADFIKYCDQRMVAMVDEANILVLATHNQDLIKKWCTRVIVLNEGKIELDTDVDSFFASDWAEGPL